MLPAAKRRVLALSTLFCLACGDSSSGAEDPGDAFAALDESRLELAREECRCDRAVGEGTATTVEECAQAAVDWTSNTAEQYACRKRVEMADPNFTSLIDCEVALNRKIAPCYRANTECESIAFAVCRIEASDDACIEVYPFSDATLEMISACSSDASAEDVPTR